MWPENVGILAIEIIFPSQYVDQNDLEKYDGVSTGKYTIGLGQSQMAFCSDREDINSLCLTVLSRLIERNEIKIEEIGRLDVGTETIVDKSKSVKSCLMQLFTPYNIYDIEGLDTTNACYGGTAALFNSINWIESSSWDGRLAIAVCGDIGVYAKGAARPTGGVGAIAMLIGPNAPLIFDRGLRSSYMQHAYDFYKPNLSSEFPTVDGKLSIKCYLNALDNCYQLYRKKFEKKYPNSNCIDGGLDTFDFILFHTPFCKMVEKSLARIGLNDFLMMNEEKRSIKYPELENFNNIKLNETYFDRDVEKTFMKTFKQIYEKKTKNSLYLANRIGNMYTPSLYSGLISLLINTNLNELIDKRIGLFSYGSGLASTMYSIKITNNVKLLDKLIDQLTYVKPLLESRIKSTPEEFSKVLEIREKNNHTAPYEPCGRIDILFPGTYYLKNIDELYRRTYERVPPINIKKTNGFQL